MDVSTASIQTKAVLGPEIRPGERKNETVWFVLAKYCREWESYKLLSSSPLKRAKEAPRNGHNFGRFTG